MAIVRDRAAVEQSRRNRNYGELDEERRDNVEKI